MKAKPKLDPEARKALALAPSRVYFQCENIAQNYKADQIEKKLSGNSSFVFVKTELVGVYNGPRTRVWYYSGLDKARAEALAAILRSEGLTSTSAVLSGNGDGDPGVLQVQFGRDL